MKLDFLNRVSGGSNPPKRTRGSTPKGVLFYLGSGLAPWACRPSIACERGSAGSTGSEGSMGVVRRIKIRSAAEYRWWRCPKVAFQSLVTSHSRLLIPSYQSPATSQNSFLIFARIPFSFFSSLDGAGFSISRTGASFGFPASLGQKGAGAVKVGIRRTGGAMIFGFTI